MDDKKVIQVSVLLKFIHDWITDRDGNSDEYLIISPNEFIKIINKLAITVNGETNEKETI